MPSSKSDDVISQFSSVVLDVNGENLTQDDILINLQINHPPFFSRFRYLVELVSADESDKAAARIRYKFYRDRGYEIKSSDMAIN